MERDCHDLNHCVKSLQGGIKAMAAMISTATSALRQLVLFSVIYM